MKPAPFEYERPETVEGALVALDQFGERAKLLAGGQSLIPMLNLRLVQPERLIDIGRLEGLRRIARIGGELRIGAAVTHNAVLSSADIARDCPLLVEACREVAHHGVRNRGTIGGSLCHNDPAAEMPVVMSVLEATLIARDLSGERGIPAATFFTGTFETALRPNELLTEIRIPIPPVSHGWAFREVSQRKGDFALLAVAAVLAVTDGLCRDVRIGYANAGSAARRAPTVEAAMEGQAPSASLFAAAAERAAQAAAPPADLHADAAYRRDLIGSLTRRALGEAAARARH